MNTEYFYNEGIIDGKRLIDAPRSYEKALIIKYKNILEKYDKECADAYKQGVYSIIIPHRKNKIRR